MKFLVDYENVGSLGLIGAEYLTSSDEVILYYSKTCDHMEKVHLDQLYASGCSFRLCRLQQAGRNALDFYITSHIGEVLGGGYKGIIAIVSRDKGFLAVREYWKARKPEITITRNANLAQCIISSNENSLRRKRVCQDYQSLELQQAISRFDRRDRIREGLESLPADDVEIRNVPELADQLMGMTAGRASYLSLMHQFGIRAGLSIYRVLKSAG